MKKIIKGLGWSFLSMFLSWPVLAVGETPPPFPTGGPTKMAEIVAYVQNAAKWFTAIVLAVAVFMLLYAGIMWMTAGGDEEKVKKARRAFMGGLIGIIVALLAWFLISVAASFLGVSLTPYNP